ncbi:hypothetical protein BC831DRAFT_101390 [Entophlyctis helioformis]|nr:hypothetical protein BC831DRAFT_101390 [Entophlyctis helioformis]
MLFDERSRAGSVDTLPIYERHDSMFLVPSRRPRGIDEGGDAGESIDEEEEEGSRADVDSRALSETADTIDLEEMYGPGRMAVVGPNSSYAGSSLASMSIGNLRHSASASTHRLDLDVAADEETGAGTGTAHRDALSPLVLETRSTRDSSDSERSDDGDIGITGGDLVLSPQATDGDDQPVVLVVKNSSANSGNTSTGTNRHHDSGFADDGDDGDVASGKPRSMVARRAVSYPGPAEQEMLKSKQQQQQREWAADRVDALLLTAASDERPGSADSLDTAASGSSSLVLEADPSACAQSPLSPLSLGTDGLYLNEGVHSDATVSSAASAALVPSAVVVA